MRECRERTSELTRRDVLALTAPAASSPASAASARAAGPEGQLTWGIHVSLAPTWFDPAETPGLITPFMVLYALQDAMVKPMPGNAITPCLAESWTASEDGLSYDFVLRKGTKFHNGDPVTAEDVKFSFQRYRGASHDLMASRVAAIETPDPRHVRFKLKEPWPDFLTFYGSATGAGWIVPKKYVEKVGDDGYKKAPIGAGPYKFVSFTPGVELVFEAFEGYWRKTPSVKRLVFKVIPEEATRLAALKRGEIDIAYSIRGELAEELRRTPGLTLKPVDSPATFWISFVDQWDPKSPWHDARVRKAASLAIDRKRHQSGTDARLFQVDRQRCGPQHLRFLLAAARSGLRSGAGQEIACRGGAPERLRRRRILLRQLVFQPRRSGAQQSRRGRHTDEAAAGRARRLFEGMGRKEIQEHRHGR